MNKLMGKTTGLLVIMMMINYSEDEEHVLNELLVSAYIYNFGISVCRRDDRT